MSRIMLALGSFVLGAFCSSLLGSQTSMIVHRGFAFTQTNSSPPTAFKIGTGAVPTVPPLSPPLTDDIFADNQGETRLDSLNCVRCSFSNIDFVYGGGLFLCDGCKIGKAKLVRLDGAALNTFRTLVLFGVIQLPGMPKQQPVNPNNGVVLAVTKNNEGTVTLVNFEK